MAKTLTTEQAAEALGVSASRIHQFRREGRLRAEKLGRDWLYNARDVAKLAATPRPSGNHSGKPRRTKIVEEEIIVSQSSLQNSSSARSNQSP